jgi:hypothetical protein
MLPHSSTISQQHSSVANDVERGFIDQALVDQKDGENLPLLTVVDRTRSPSLYFDYTRIWTLCMPLLSSELLTALALGNDNLQEDMLLVIGMYNSPRF